MQYHYSNRLWKQHTILSYTENTRKSLEKLYRLTDTTEKIEYPVLVYVCFSD